jgi:hypothetical protein
VIDLDRPYALDAAAIGSFRENGFVRFNDVFSAEELGHYGPELTRLTLALSN